MPNRYALPMGTSQYDRPVLRDLDARAADIEKLAAGLGDGALGGYRVTT